MQEEVEMRTVTMAFHASKFSGRVMKNGIAKLLHAMHGQLTVPHGKQSVRQLARQNQGMTNIEIDDPERWAAGADTAINRKWWDFMADIMETNPDNSPVSVDLPVLFHLD